MSASADDDDLPDDEVIATLSDYVDGTLPKERIGEVEAKIAADPVWKRTHDELRETKEALSGLHKARAPATFEQDVTATIAKRSAGRFFARRTLGDRVPFGALLIVAMLALVGITYVMWSSPTGSLKVDRTKSDQPPGSGLALPKP